jgi:hypothetical protein
VERFNPFNELYVTETVSSDEFVELFSPALLDVTGALFLPGNVVLKGVQGSGKSMLLNLLKPDVRIAYEKQRHRFPLSGKYSRFIGAGINLTTSGAIAFGQRTVPGAGLEQLPIYFGDFLNYWIVYDLLQSIESFRDGLSKASIRTIELKTDGTLLDDFAQQLGASRCWFDYLRGTGSYRELKRRLQVRLNAYLSFLNFNTDDVPKDIQSSKTLIGEPISRAAELLRTCGIIQDKYHVFVRIDQHEELFRLEGLQKDFGPKYRAIINKALGMRNPHVSYRIGTRGYAWGEYLDFFGTTARLERERNYKLIDLDEMLRRRENSRTWIFPKFAEDVFARRLNLGRREQDRDRAPNAGAGLLKRVLGNGPSSEQRARLYCRNSPQWVIRPQENWPRDWTLFLQRLAIADPLSARLGEAWALQRNKSKVMYQIPAKPYPWDTAVYWKKERVQAALMQIAGRCFQRMMWAGREDVLELSGGNILIFVSLCQLIWSAWLRTKPNASEDPLTPRISDSVQAVAIQEASTVWFEKIEEEAGGNSRQRFVRVLANLIQKKLSEDSALSYPGHNGFSLLEDQLDQDQTVQHFLHEAVAFGTLFEIPHTTKLKDRKPRKKWYCNPILSPYFRIPHVHTKEPMYVDVSEVRHWMRAAEEPETTTNDVVSRHDSTHHISKAKETTQGSLFTEDPTKL